MERRKFLKQVVGAAALTALSNKLIALALETVEGIPEPPFVASGTINFSNNLITDPDAMNVVIDVTTKTIHVNPETRGAIDIRDLYSYLKEQWREDEELRKFRFPMKAHHNRFYETDYKLRPPEAFSGGTLKIGDEMWSDEIVTLGHFS